MIFKPLWWLFHCLFKAVSQKFYDMRAAAFGRRDRAHRERKKIGRKRRGELIFYACLLIYPLTQFFIFYVLVNFNSLLLAFKSYDSVTATYGFGIGFGNFKTFLSDVARDYSMRSATINSFLLYACTLIIGMPLNLIFSFFMYKKIPFNGFFRVVLFLPSMISSLVIALMFRYFVETGLSELSFPGFNLLLNKTTGFPTMIFYSIWSGFGTQILIYTSSMSQVDTSIVESARLDGANLLKEFWHITLPAIFPTITTFLVAGVSALFTNQAGLYSFYGANARDDMLTLGYVFFSKVALANESNFAQYPYASAAGLLFTLVAAPITLLVKWALEKFGPSAE